MVTHNPHQIASDGVEPCEATREDDGLGTRVIGRMRQVLCGLHGHDNLLQFEHDRMFLRCASCGHETPGWDISEAPPAPVAQEEQEIRRPAMAPARLARRVA